jgi:RNA polymerase primary sigma factor
MYKDYHDSGRALCGRIRGQRLSHDQERAVGSVIPVERRKLVAALCDHPQGLAALRAFYTQDAGKFFSAIWQPIGVTADVANNNPLFNAQWRVVGVNFNRLTRADGREKLIDAILALRPKDGCLEDILDGLKKSPRLIEHEAAIKQASISLKHMRAAKEELIMANQGLIGAVVRKYSYADIPIADLWQEGRIGLTKAAEVYDPARADFGKIAGFYIKAALVEATGKDDAIIHVPPDLRAEARKLAQKADQFRQEYGHQPDDVALAAYAKLPLDKIQSLHRIPPPPLMYDQFLVNGEGRPLINAIPDPMADNPEEQCISNQTSNIVKRARQNLPPRLQDVLYGRFDEDQTHREIGEKYRVTSARVRQLETQAKKMLVDAGLQP